MAILSLDRLRKRYGPIEALRDVTLDVTEGEIFGLLGPNGAGKTTLIKTLVGSTRPSSGTVRVLGLDPVTQAPAVRRQIGYMPQAPVLYEDLSARDNVRFFAQGHRIAELDRRVDDVLELTGLTARAGGAVYTFSGGMKQRVSLACALVHSPRLLLLDEPTAGVDPRLRETFWKHFRARATAGATLLVSTHQMDEALLCDRLAVLRNGSLLACDTPRGLLSTGRARVRIHTARGEPEVVDVADYADALPRLLRHHRLDESVTRIEVEQDSLETIVLALIRSREDADVAGS